jgi:hypothetical protein
VWGWCLGKMCMKGMRCGGDGVGVWGEEVDMVEWEWVGCDGGVMG